MQDFNPKPNSCLSPRIIHETILPIVLQQHLCGATNRELVSKLRFEYTARLLGVHHVGCARCPRVQSQAQNCIASVLEFRGACWLPACRNRDFHIMEECCAVCAEPLRFCAFGPCQHQGICSSCVARMRLVQNNTDCAICRKPCPQVFVTRFMDTHTRRIGTDAWEELVVCSCLLHPVHAMLLAMMHATAAPLQLA